MGFVQGWTKVSLLDYPDHICSVIFTAGCNLRCPYCHNKELVLPGVRQHGIAWQEISHWLETKGRMIDGVCFTGGEPTLHQGLESMVRDVKKINFKVKVDTNGTNPQLLKRLLDSKLLDFVAMDIKAPLNKYNQICRSNVDIRAIEESVELIKACAPSYEFRTTFHPALLSIEDFYHICEWLEGASVYVVQSCRTGNNLDPLFEELPPVDDQDLQDIANLCKEYFPRFLLRGFTFHSFHRTI